MADMLTVPQNIDYAKNFILPLLKLLQRQHHSPVRAGFIGKRLGLTRGQTLTYLRALEVAGLVKLEGKKWKVAGEINSRIKTIEKDITQSVLLLATQCIEYAKCVVLPLLQLLQRQQAGKPVRSGLVGEHLGLQRRQTYNYLWALEIAGLVRLEGKRWKVA